MQKKYVGLVIGFLILVVSSSGCISIGGLVNNLNNGNSTYSGNGVSFNYPSNWQVSAINQSGNHVIFVTKDPSTDSPQFQFEIESNPKGMSDQEAMNAEQAIPEGWTKISNSTLKIDNKTAIEEIFMVNDTHYNELMEFEQIFIIKNGNTYYLTFQAPENDFENEKENFDIILNSFKVQ